MNPWLIIAIVTAGMVFGTDYLLRKKKWKDNSMEEKISLLVNMLSVGPYAFLSVLGKLWGIAASHPETAFGEVLYDATLMMGGLYFIVAAAAVIMSFILRKCGKTKASIWINVIALVYIAVILAVNSLAGKLL